MTQQNLHDKSILLIISGGIAAYKSLELIRLIRKSGGHVRCILTKAGEQFVTPMSVAALSEEEVYTDLWSLKNETEMGHIRLSREADLIIIAPASANILAQMAQGLASDLASTTLLANDKPILVAPAMNHKMWDNPATQNNIEILQNRGIQFTGPVEGDMACGEYGMGRMAEPEDILKSVTSFFLSAKKPLRGKTAIVTAGPTYEPIDPVRFLGNHSSGKQGYAIAEALYEAGADVTLISGPTALKPPIGVNTIKVQTAEQMLQATEKALPADMAVFTAAVSDWRADKTSNQKIKKSGKTPALKLTENPDILKTIVNHKNRPTLVIGFAAETENLLENAAKKRKTKGADWILANDVSGEKTFGSDTNHVYLITSETQEDWGKSTKKAIARKLADEICKFLTPETMKNAAE